jgi:hypothetical protein
MEVILFKMKFINRSTRTNDFFAYGVNLIKGATLEDIIIKLKDFNRIGFHSYWKLEEESLKFFNDNEFKDFFNTSKDATKFLLWKYENYLKMGSNDSKHILLLEDFTQEKGNFSSIEHIYPQNLKDANDQPIVAPNWLHNIGNLAALCIKENTSKSNNPVKDKYENHKTSLLHHNKFIDKLKENNWQMNETFVFERRKEITDFVKEYFYTNIDESKKIL